MEKNKLIDMIHSHDIKGISEIIENLEKELDRKFKEWENQRDTIEKMNIQINELKEKFITQIGYINKITNLNTSIVKIIEQN